MNEKRSFVLYFDIRHPLELLSDEDRGKLFLALLDYAELGTVRDFGEGALQMAFAFIRNSIDRDAAAWEEKRQKRIEAGRLGGLAKVANATNAKQGKADLAVNVPVPVPVNVPVPGNVIIEETNLPKKRKKPFVPPSEEECISYQKEKNLVYVDPSYFWNYYDAGGWTNRDGTPVLSWKQTMISWNNREKRDREKRQAGKTNIRDPADYEDAEGSL